jgi:hypothetical protein
MNKKMSIDAAAAASWGVEAHGFRDDLYRLKNKTRVSLLFVAPFAQQLQCNHFNHARH